MITIYRPGSQAHLVMPGTFGKEVLIEDVRIDRNLRAMYLVRWWDDGVKSCWVDSEDLHEAPTVKVETCECKKSAERNTQDGNAVDV